jgi:hypothetical protein
MLSISKINILNCIVYLARKERYHVIKIRALVIFVHLVALLLPMVENLQIL